MSAARTGDRRGWVLRAAVLAAVVMVALVVAFRPVDAPAFQASGPPLALPPAGTLTAASGDEFEGMLVGLRGRPVIVNVWASWCTPCRAEAPLLARAARAQSRVVILGVASKDLYEPARRFMREFDMDYVNVFDETEEIRQRLQLTGFPTTYVFDRDGVLVSTVVGGLTERALAAAIERVS